MKALSEPSTRRLRFALLAIGVAAAFLMVYGMIRWRRFEEAKPSNRLVARLGPIMKGFKDYDPDTATPHEQALVKAAGEALMRSGMVREGYLPLSRKHLRRVSAQKGWEVGFWSESQFEDDHHIYFLVVDVDNDGNATFAGKLVEM